MGAKEWIRQLKWAAGKYISDRREEIASVAVRLTLHDGETVFISKISASPDDSHLLIEPYPDDVGTMMPGDPTPLTRTAIFVPPDAIIRVDFMPEAPGQRTAGFTVE